MYVSWWRNFIKVLVSLPYPENYHHRLVTELKLHLGDSAIFDEFQRDYTVDDERRRGGAVWWYTRSSYFYGILNRALRQRNVRLLLLYGSFLQDLHRQLTSESHTQSCIVTLYRGQVLSQVDFAKLEVGYPIRSNNLFSMSTDRELALAYLGAVPHVGVERVLFEIEVDYNRNHHQALFADISQGSYFLGEKETLFMTNTWFLIESCRKMVSHYDELPYALVKLRLESDYDMRSARKLEAGTDRKTVKNCVNALSEMLDMASSKDVNVVFDALTELYSRETKWILAVKLYCLAILERERVDENYTVAVSYHQRAIAHWQECLHSDDGDELNCSFDIGENHYALGQLYRYRIEDPENLSFQHLEKALDFYELALEKCSAADYERTDILVKLVKVCTDLENEHGKAIKYQKERLRLMLEEPVLSQKESMANAFQHLARLHQLNQEYDEALSGYEKALEVYYLSEKPSLLYLIDLYKHIVKICIEHKRDFSLALRYQLQQHDHELKWVLQSETQGEDVLICSELNYLAGSHFSLADVYMKIEQCAAACEHLTKGLEYSRKRRELLLSEGRFVIRSADGSPLPELLSGADTRLKRCESKIKEYEEKLKLVVQSFSTE
jgi:tetratricopeptide (TPR) repeat protein